MKRMKVIPRTLLAATALFLGQTAHAETHVVIINSYAAKDFAFLDITAEPLNTVSYVVNPVGQAPISVSGSTNGNNFVTSSDLLAAAGGKLAMVVATTNNPALLSTGVLRQRGQEFLVGPLDQLQGHAFAFPLGDLGDGASLYIGTPLGFPAQVQVSYGSLGNQSVSFWVDSSTVGELSLTVPNTRVVVIVTSSAPVIAQLFILGKGGRTESTMLLPLGP
jgi:hypothetical protein